MANPLQIVGYDSDGRPCYGGIFRLADTEGFPLEMSIEMACERGMEVFIPAYVADAIAAGWPAERAVKSLVTAYREIGCPLLEETQRIIWQRIVPYWRQWTTKACVKRLRDADQTHRVAMENKAAGVSTEETTCPER